jgi:hypothetical protein
MSACGSGGPLGLKVSDVVRAALAVSRPSLCAHHWKILNVLLACRTPRLGGHRYRCEHCGAEHFVPHGCGNRHCPDCQARQANEWLERQQALLLPVPYFHVVFTLSHALNPVVQQNRRALYTLLLQSAAHTLLAFGRNNLGVQLGLTAVLHTWSQTLLDHYHAHCIVTGGGLKLNGDGWQTAASDYLFPVVALGRVFRGKFCEGLQRLYAKGQLHFHGQQAHLAQPTHFQTLVRQATAKSWNVYVKRPFAGPKQVLGYLSRYTHRVAIGSRRLLHLDQGAGTIRFAYQDRRAQGRTVWRTMTLSLPEFLRRFCLHLLPQRFVKIRHYGLLANRGRKQRVAQAQALLGVSPPSPNELNPAAEGEAESAGTEHSDARRWICPVCGHRALVWIETVGRAARAPPTPHALAA